MDSLSEMKEFLNWKKEMKSAQKFQILEDDKEKLFESPRFVKGNLYESLEVRVPKETKEYSPSLTWSIKEISLEEITQLRTKVDDHTKESFKELDWGIIDALLDLAKSISVRLEEYNEDVEDEEED